MSIDIDFAANAEPPSRHQIRRAVERVQSELGTVAFHASVWEGREGWAGHPDEARDEHGRKALTELETLRDTIGDLAIVLRNRLRAEDNLPVDPDDPDGILADVVNLAPTDPREQARAIAELELDFPEARQPGDEHWDDLSGWQQGVRYYWDEQTTHAQVLAEFRELRAAGQTEAAPRYVAIVAELGAETAEALWDKAGPTETETTEA